MSAAGRNPDDQQINRAKALKQEQAINDANVEAALPASAKNCRPLDEIEDDINSCERASIFRIGQLLTEAKDSHPGEFLAWADV